MLKPVLFGLANKCNGSKNNGRSNTYPPALHNQAQTFVHMFVRDWLIRWVDVWWSMCSMKNLFEFRANLGTTFVILKTYTDGTFFSIFYHTCMPTMAAFVHFLFSSSQITEFCWFCAGHRVPVMKTRNASIKKSY